MSNQDRLAAQQLRNALDRSRSTVKEIVPRVERLKSWARVGLGPARVLSAGVGAEPEDVFAQLNTLTQNLEKELEEIVVAIEAATSKVDAFSPRKKRCRGCGG